MQRYQWRCCCLRKARPEYGHSPVRAKYCHARSAPPFPREYETSGPAETLVSSLPGSPNNATATCLPCMYRETPTPSSDPTSVAGLQSRAVLVAKEYLLQPAACRALSEQSAGGAGQGALNHRTGGGACLWKT